MLRTVSIVPVGLTEHRKDLIKIPPITKKYSDSVILQLEVINARYQIDKSITPFVLYSDEWFLISKQKLPSYNNLDVDF